MMQKIKKTKILSRKLISEEMLLDNRKIYFGTLILVNIEALLIKDPMPAEVDSRKK